MNSLFAEEENIETPPQSTATTSLFADTSVAADDAQSVRIAPLTEDAISEINEAFTNPATPEPELFVNSVPDDLTSAENVRNAGLAYSAGIVIIASIVFMMILGWFADLFLGSTPWGLVGGIILGSVLGFVQFFRITSQISSHKKSKSEIHSLMNHNDDQ